MLFDLVVLEEHRLKFESQLSEAKDLQRDLKIRLERNQRDETEYAGKLKYSAASMSSHEAQTVNTKLEAAKKAVEDVTMLYKTSQRKADGIEWTLKEIRVEMDRIYADFKTKFGPLTASGIKANDAAATANNLQDSPEKPLDDDVGKVEDKVKKLSESKKVSSLREGISRLADHLSEIAHLKLFVHDPLAPDVPHFSAWDQRTQTTIFTAKEKVERVQRYCANVLNALSSTYPALAQDNLAWTHLVSLVDDAIRRITLRNVRDALWNYEQVFAGKSSREIFAINLKLGANCRVSFVPLATELSQLIMNIVNKITNIGSETYIGELISTPASTPSTVLGGEGKEKGLPFIRSHCEFITTDMEVSGHITSIRSSSSSFSEDIVSFVVDVEQRFEYLWKPDMTAISQSELLDSMDKLKGWNCESSLGKGAVLINAFPLQDSVLSMCATQLQRLKTKDEEKSCSESEVQKLIKKSTLSMCLHAPWSKKVSLKQQVSSPSAKEPTTAVKAVPPIPTAAAASSATTSSNAATPRLSGGRLPPLNDQENSSARALKAASTGSTPASQSSAPTGNTPRGLQPRQLNADPSSTQPRESSLSGNKRLSNSGANASENSQLTPRDSPRDNARPSTTPVSTRPTRSAGATQSLTPQKYQGPASLRSDAGVYARALGINQQVSPSSSTASPVTANEGGSRSVEVLKPIGGRPLESSPTTAASSGTGTYGSVPEVQPLNASSNKKSAWGTPTKNTDTSRDRSDPIPPSPIRGVGGSTGGIGAPYSLRQSPRKVGGSPTNTTVPHPPPGSTSRGNSPKEDEEEITRMLQKEQDTLRRIRELKEKEEQRRAASQTTPTKSAKEMLIEEKQRKEKEEREKAAVEARQAEIRRQQTAEQQRKLREAELEEEKVKAVKQQRESENRRKQQEMEERLEAEMKRREQEQLRLQEERRSQEQAVRAKEEEARRSELEKLEKLREEEEKRQVEAMADYQRKMQRLNDETSALRKKLQLPPVQPPSQRVPAEPSSPSPVRNLSASGSRPLPTTTPNNQNTSLPRPGSSSQTATSPSRHPYTLPNRPPSSQALQMTPLPFEDDGVERSLLDDYRRCCAAANIKPNSGLLKKLPKEVGEHIQDINLDLNYIGVKGVQPLIHILKKNRGLRLLNLKDNNLENNEVRQLVSVLLTESGNTLECIDLSNNPISLAGGSALLDLVTAKKSLTKISLKGTLIQPRVVDRIVEAATENAKLSGQ